MRAYWKGHLKLSLVTIAVDLNPATESASRLQLHQIDKNTGKRIRYEKTVPGEGKVDQDDIIRGVDVGAGKIVTLTPQELDNLKLETRHTIELVQFVEYCDIDPRYFERPYYLVPSDDVAAEGYAVIRDALKSAKRAGIGQMTMRGKESLVAVRPCGKGLLLETLRYADELRSSEKAFADVGNAKPQKEMVDLAVELIGRKSVPFKVDAFKDHYGDALKALVEEKRKRGKVSDSDETDERPARGNVIDLMEALRKSVKKDSAAPAARKSAVPKKRARR